MLSEIIECPKLTLRKPDSDDAAFVYSKWAQDKEVTKYVE